MSEHKVDQAELEKIDIFRILQEFGKAMGRLWWLVLVLAVACGGALGLRAWRSYTPMYASEVTFTIQMDSNSLTDIGGSTSYYDKATAEQLTKTFPYLVQSELMQTKLRQAMPRTRDEDFVLLGYLFAGLDAASVSLILGIPVNNIYSRKNRLKERISKLDLPEKTFYLKLIS